MAVGHPALRAGWPNGQVSIIVFIYLVPPYHLILYLVNILFPILEYVIPKIWEVNQL